MLNSIEITYKVKEETDILFKVLKNSRKLDQNTIIEAFDNSFKVSKLETMKILFYSRDIKAGLGEKEVLELY